MLNTIGLVMLVVGGLLILCSLILMIVWKIPSLVDEISGKKAKRLIKRMKDANEAIASGITGSVATVGLSSISVDIATEEVVPTDTQESTEGTGSELNRLVNDPYGTVGGKRRESEEGYKKDFTMQAKPADVIIIEEQSSIVFQ